MDTKIIWRALYYIRTRQLSLGKKNTNKHCTQQIATTLQLSKTKINRQVYTYIPIYHNFQIRHDFTRDIFLYKAL